ncbi:hypothetical protein C7H19_07540 [Aphanothece hegewaldii CCALA 016]|uniref:ParE-like toxin domain-containing protein n=1 Tax=Aphanothece hegewaldii CCALA 016 TaxID=2107694 RepID=A0A2T1LZI2_9CHRO|nr:hypothetical protein [Aphanothece hegewaldii]PSF37828.1 hypothetical protein C7H19_07540 [Aphanothece hegewaldii CCALA 016]
MKSCTTANFRQTFSELPLPIQEQARLAYRQFKINPRHPSLRFKQVNPKLSVYSACISKDYRALGQVESDTIIWFWIGSHSDYDKLLSQL